MKALVTLVTALLSISAAAPRTQTQTPTTFDAVSITPNTTGRGAGGGLRGNRYTANNQSVLDVLMGAYRITADRISGAPDWIHTTRYDIAATTTTGKADDVPAMLEALLRERFGLRAHTESRGMPVYVLVGRTDRSLGPGITPSTVDCTSAVPESARRTGNELATRAGCAERVDRGRISLRSASINAFARALSATIGRQVLNHTSRQGRFDIDVTWTPTAQATDGPAIAAAIQEQLGLRLQMEMEPIEMLIIDRIERPTIN